MNSWLQNLTIVPTNAHGDCFYDCIGRVTGETIKEVRHAIASEIQNLSQSQRHDVLENIQASCALNDGESYNYIKTPTFDEIEANIRTSGFFADNLVIELLFPMAYPGLGLFIWTNGQVITPSRDHVTRAIYLTLLYKNGIHYENLAFDNKQLVFQKNTPIYTTLMSLI